MPQQLLSMAKDTSFIPDKITEAICHKCTIEFTVMFVAMDETAGLSVYKQNQIFSASYSKLPSYQTTIYSVPIRSL